MSGISIIHRHDIHRHDQFGHSDGYEDDDSIFEVYTELSAEFYQYKKK